MSPFTEEFESLLPRGKYSKWATDIDVTTLYALLWFIGEFGYRSNEKDYINPYDNISNARRDIGMESILRIFRGERFSGDVPIDAAREVFSEAMDRRKEEKRKKLIKESNDNVLYFPPQE